MKFSKLRYSNFYQDLRNSFLFSFLKKIYCSISPWHLSLRIKRLERDYSFLMLKHQNSIKRLSKIFTSDELNVSNFITRSLILDDEADQASPNTQAKKIEGVL